MTLQVTGAEQQRHPVNGVPMDSLSAYGTVSPGGVEGSFKALFHLGLKAEVEPSEHVTGNGTCRSSRLGADGWSCAAR